MERRNITPEQLEKAEQEFNRMQILFFASIQKMEEALEILPQKGDKPEFCQKMTIIDCIKRLEYALNGLCIEDLLEEQTE